MVTNTRQSDKPCPECGSWYRSGDQCNVCGVSAPVAESFYKQGRFSYNNRKAKGRIWDSKAHKYKKILTKGDV